MGNQYIKSNRKISLFAEAGVLVEDDIYFFSSEYNLLYKVHMPDFTLSIISHIPCGRVLAVEWFRKMRYWNGKLLFIPSYAEKIWIYDLNSGQWDSITIDYPQTELKFEGAVIYKDDAFLFGILYPVILKVNLNSRTVSYIEIEYQPERKNGEEGLFFTEAVRMGHVVFCPVSISNHVFQFDLDSFEYQWKQIGDKGNKYSGIDYDKENFWISSGWSGKVVKWDGDSEWEEFEVPKEIAERSYQFIGVICDGNKIKFLTQQDGKSLEIVNGEIDGAQILLTKATKRYVHLERYENGTIALMQSNAHIDIKWGGKWIRGICEIDHEDFKTYFDKALLWNSNGLSKNINEMELLKVNDYIELVVNQKENLDEFSAENDIGLNIWAAVR